MTRKDYIAIAAIIDRRRLGLTVAQDFAEVFAADNPRFNRATFISACFAHQRKPEASA